MTQILLDGVEENQRKKAKADIESYVKNFFHETENPVYLIHVAKNFQDAIRDLTHVSDYAPEHEYGTAAAKTMPFKLKGKLVFVIILDGEIFGKWDKTELIFRTTTFIHELVHVEDGYRRWLVIGNEQFFVEPKGKNGWLSHSAQIIWEEYDASRLTIEFLANLAKELNGKLNDPQTLGNAETLYSLLCTAHDFVKQCIVDFKKNKLTSGQVCYKITGRVLQVLILWAYVYPAVSFVDTVKKRLGEIEQLEGYSFLLSENLPNIRLLLEELYIKRREYLPDLIGKIGEEMEKIVKKCGLIINEHNGELQYVISDID